MPCSGRTLPVPHFGPPIAPRRTASAALAASRAWVVKGSPVASIEHCGGVSGTRWIQVVLCDSIECLL